MSIAGGVHCAVQRAAQVGCDCVQVFTGSPSQWSVTVAAANTKAASRTNRAPPNSSARIVHGKWTAKTVSDDEAQQFRQALASTGVGYPISHDSYLINLASPDDELWDRSIAAFVVELARADRLGIPFVVAHPGAHMSATADEGIERIVAALDEAHRRTPNVNTCCLLETTAGQGTCLGHRFEHLGAIIAGVKQPDRLGVCVDTCHVFAAGYPLAPKRDYLATFRALDKAVGLERVQAFHLNDSKRELGSRVDRHEHIGRGKLGLEPFRLLLNDRRFRRTPMYLETAKGMENGEELDAINLRTLRSLVGKAASA
jgi:deoxyribonuclease-4